jgi:tetratricopeptide (TPR) repeat protein
MLEKRRQFNGYGKTQLAAEFVHRYGQFFRGGVFWLSFSDPAAVPAEVAACAMGLIAPADFGGLPLEDQVRLVLAAWQSPLPRLLVFDNCEDEALLASWRPPTGGCRVLLTSWRADWDAALGVQALPLDVLSRAESVALLRKLRPDLAEGDLDLHAIAAELGDLPLALHLAGSFLKQYRAEITPSVYLAELHSTALLGHESLQGIDLTISPTNHELHAGRTFALSYERLHPNDATDTLALALLARAACFAPGEPIPRDLLLATVEAPDAAARRHASRALKRLGALGLLEAVADVALRLHRLLATFVRATVEDTDALAVVEQVMIERATELNSKGYPAPLLALQIHLRHLTDTALVRRDEMAARFCNELGYYLRMIGDLAGARPYLEQALAIRHEMLGERHPDTAQSLNNLGYLLQARGDLAAAWPYLEQALAIRREMWASATPTPPAA